MFKEELPRAVCEELDRRGLNGVPVLLAAHSDLSLSGRPERSWVVATRDNVTAVRETSVVRGSHDPAHGEAEAVRGQETRAQPAVTIETYVPVSEVREFRTQGAIGSGFLQAYVDDYWVDLARFPNTDAERFGRFAKYLEGLRTGTPPEQTDEPAPKVTHCPKCGQRLPVAGESCPRCIPRKAIIGRLVQMLWPHRRTALVMCGLMFVAVAAELVPPKLQQYMVDDILRGGQGAPDPAGLFSALLVVVSALAGARLVLSAVNFAKGRMATRVGVALTYDLRGRLVEKLHSLGLNYYDRHQVGSLTSRVAYDSEVIQSLLQQITGGFLLQIVQVTAVGVMLFTLNPKLAVYTLIPAPLVIAGSIFFWKRVHPKHYRYWDSSSKQAGMLTGMLSGIRVVKAFAQEEREYGRFNRISDYLRNCRMRVDYSTAAFSATMQLIFSLGGLIVWYVGGRDVLAGTMSLGSLMAFLAYLAMFYTPLATLSQFTTWLTNFLTGCQRVFELLDTPVETTDPENPVELPPVGGRVPLASPVPAEELQVANGVSLGTQQLAAASEFQPQGLGVLCTGEASATQETKGRGIRFERVTFGYERHQPVLRDVDFEIRPGETIGIVGRSGSGKTTLVNLLCRFYDVCEGRVLVDGVDVRRLALRELRRHIGVVLQEPFLFRGTIWQNLVYGLPEATPEQAIASAKAAQAHDFILNSPLGYDTWLGERGAGLSGGERQRLSIARAILFDPPILVLDEATSSVDAESEQAIQAALRALTRGRTTIAIAHRLSTLREADRILVFDRGRLIEQGSHEELLARDGQYANLVRIQGDARRLDDSVDGLLQESPPLPISHSPTLSPQWLMPGDATITTAKRGGLEIRVASSLRDAHGFRRVPLASPVPADERHVVDNTSRGSQQLADDLLYHLQGLGNGSTGKASGTQTGSATYRG
ncbi:MAG TPA: ABC transporter ATP-binding protein, partial [Lacipirellulaceae bacterium]|nr:ABC transporter ATP-binding protein [Lacipirellulaceae bacterium]